MKPKENYNRFKHVTKLIANIISWTVLVILLILASFLLYYYIANKIYASKGEQYSPYIGLYTIVSPSMTPNLNVYDVIVDVKVKKPEDIKVGDIITFISTSSISKGYTVTHRVVAILETENGKEYKTQGDNNLSPDTATVEFKNVLGKVILKVPQLGRIQYFLSSSYGWLLIVVIPALIVIISDIIKIIKLSGAKKKVNVALETEEKKELIEKQKKDKIKKELKKRYRIERNLNEPDPLETNHELTKISVGEKEIVLKKPAVEMKFELPKLKVEEPKEEKKKNSKKRNKKSTKKKF
ncbi:MAG: signal peptidase I [Bacilli bacterium]|nr:signal peptidase I [Bacilli bacterium]